MKMLYYLYKLENLIERWQSRKRTIEISKLSATLLIKNQQAHPPAVKRAYCCTKTTSKSKGEEGKDEQKKMSPSHDHHNEEINELKAVTNNKTKNNLNKQEQQNILINNIAANRKKMTKNYQEPLQQAVVVSSNDNNCSEESAALMGYNSHHKKEEDFTREEKENIYQGEQQPIGTGSNYDNHNKIANNIIEKNDCMREEITTSNCFNNDNATKTRKEAKDKILKQHNYLNSSVPLTICPSLIYVMLLFYVILLYANNNNSISAFALASAGGGAPSSGKLSSTLSNNNNSNIISELKESDRAKKALNLFVKQLAANRDRWTNIPDYTTNVNNNQLIRWARRRVPASQQQQQHHHANRIFSSSTTGSRPSVFGGGSLDSGSASNRVNLRQLMNRIRTRIGARNSIRVHNAFRDLAWRLLSSFSMPTPVIYELRRQHFYSPEDDELNDSLFDKNTTKTIRTRRQLPTNPRAGDDDDDEDESLRGRIRLRLEDLANLSRRSLFGRVVRLPSIFPFKRQQQDLTDIAPTTINNKNITNNKQTESKTNQQARKLSRLSALRARQKRKKKEADRQMIIINGKQYYVNDSGELKEWLEDSKND